MILLRLAVEDWKGLRGRVEVGPLGPGLNLIFGPNETGKSTLLDALCRGFFDRYNTGGEEMKKRQPWGTGLGPRVEIDFEVAGQRYRLNKRFLAEPVCELSIWRSGAWEMIERGKTADEKIIALASGESTGKGMTKPEHWGLGQVLWTQQGQATELAVGESQQNRLREALRLTIDGAQGEAVEQVIHKLYDAVYSDKGKVRSGQQNMAAVLRLAGELDLADAAVRELQERLAAVEQTSHDLAAAEAEHEATQVRLRTAQEALKQQNARMGELTARQVAYAQLEAAHAGAREKWTALNERIKRIAAADEAVVKAQAAAEESGRRSEATAGARVSAEAAAASAREESETRAAAAEAAEAARAAAERVTQWIEGTRQAAAAERQTEQARARAKAIADARAELAAITAPTLREIEALRKLQAQISQKRAELAAASLRVRIEPATPLQVATRIDDRENPKARVDQPIDLSAIGAAEIHIEGVGRILIRAGHSDAGTLAEEAGKLERTWRERAASFGSPMPGEIAPLEALHARRNAAEQNLATLERQPGSSPTELPTLEQGLRDAQAKLQALLAEDPAIKTRETTPDAAAAELASARTRLVDAKSRLTNALAFAKEQARLAETARTRAEEAARQKAIDAALHDAKVKEADALRRADGQTDAQRRDALHAALSLLDQARQRLEAAERPPVEDLRRDIAVLERQIGELNQALQNEEHQLGRLRKTIEDAGGEGLYSRLAEAVERAEDLRARHRQEELDANAVKLLWETMQGRKRETLDALMQPIRLAVETQFTQLVGPRYARVEFDERLAPSAVRPAGRDVEAGTDTLSFGTREQLMLLVRLSLARLLAREGQRQCVILDDPLVNADPARQRAALLALQQAAAEAQVIILTCDPQTFQGLEGVNRIDLQERVRAARG